MVCVHTQGGVCEHPCQEQQQKTFKRHSTPVLAMSWCLMFVEVSMDMMSLVFSLLMLIVLCFIIRLYCWCRCVIVLCTRCCYKCLASPWWCVATVVVCGCAQFQVGMWC